LWGFWTAVASAGLLANNLHLSRQITTPASQNSIFTGWMLFLTPRPNRLYQSTDKKGKGNRGEAELVVQNYSVTISAAEIDPQSTSPLQQTVVARNILEKNRPGAGVSTHFLPAARVAEFGREDW